jgi:hypothetical protein
MAKFAVVPPRRGPDGSRSQSSSPAPTIGDFAFECITNVDLTSESFRWVASARLSQGEQVTSSHVGNCYVKYKTVLK